MAAARLADVAAEWDDLATATNTSPFVRPGWIEAWWRAFGRGDLRILAARRDGALVAALPVALGRGAVRSPTNEHTPAFDVVASDEAAARAIGGALAGSRVRAIALGRLAAGGTAHAAVDAACNAAGYRTEVVPVARAPYIACAPTLEEHERGMSRNLRHDVQRRLRRLGDEGSVAIEVRDGKSDLDAALDEGFRVEARGWKGSRGTAVASDARTRAFYGGIARWAAARGWLRLAFLRLDGRAIAFQFDLEAGATYYSLKIGYDPTLDRYSPGKLLAYAMVGRAVSTGLATYELLGTDEPWKHRWTSTFRPQVRLQAYAPPRPGASSSERCGATRAGRLARRASRRVVDPRGARRQRLLDVGVGVDLAAAHR